MYQSGLFDLLDEFLIKFTNGSIQMGQECSIIICLAFSRLLRGKVK